MLKIVQAAQNHILKHTNIVRKLNFRTFLSQAYHCEDVWNQRLNSPILQVPNLEELYFELEQRFNKTKQLSAIDVDIFANSIKNNSFSEELLDIVHKLRLTAEAGNIVDSTAHAVVRVLSQCEKFEDLLNALDDRMNYGLFLDYYTANLLMNTFWKSKEYAHGARIAGQLMLQEEFEHPLSCDLALLHCYNYLLSPNGWPEYKPPEEPEEEIKIRVKYLRNPFDDDHFDLKDPKRIIGKTLITISKNKNDPLHQSFHILGLALFGNNAEVEEEVLSKTTENLYKEVLDLLPENSKLKNSDKIKTESVDLINILINNVKKSVQQTEESDISQQCQLFDQWIKTRSHLLDEQVKRLTTAKRLENIEDLKKSLKDKEERLWFFENEETIDLAIEGRRKFHVRRWYGPKKLPRKTDSTYVPPEV